MDLTVVVSVYNEESALPHFIERARGVLDALSCEAEFLFVNDGSADRSADIVTRASAGDPRFRLLNLSRNFGHEAAMIAGIDHAKGAAVICMDADLQHPLDEIPRMMAAHDAGNDVVIMVREWTEALPLRKKLASRLFYFVINTLSPAGLEPNASDFFLLSRRVAEALRAEYRERVRFLRGYIQVLGYRKTTLKYVAAKRDHGESRYTLRALWELSLNGILGFSNLPLRLGVMLGAITAAFGVALAIYTIVMQWRGDPPSGYTTIVVTLCFLFAIQFTITGIIGEYVGHVFAEVKRRPIYLVDDPDRSGRC